jgi:hypothetical protein
VAAHGLQQFVRDRSEMAQPTGAQGVKEGKVQRLADFRYGSMLSKKSKIERRQKSRKL